MTVDPVHASTSGIERPTPEKKLYAIPTPRAVDSRTNFKVEIAKPKNVPAPLAIPEHEVKVVLDTPENNIMVYQVLDKESGGLVLQVPSAEQLRAMHQTQELLQQVAARGKAAIADAPVAKEEWKNNGNKL